MNENDVKKKLQEVLSLVLVDVSSIRSGKANPSMVQELSVAVYGGQSKLKILELATVSAPDPNSLVISPFDKSIIGEIKKGIEAANLGMNPNIDGEIIRISVPPMTTEDREKFVKLLSQKLESGRIMVRQIRGDAMKDFKKAFESKGLTEDEKFAKEKKLQEIVDEFVGKIDKVGEKKKAELMQI